MTSFGECRRLEMVAVHAFNNGQHRVAADNYLASFTVWPDPWEKNRWQPFHGYTSILREKYFVPAQSDLDALEKTMEDKSEPKLYRIEAAFTRGLLLWDSGDRETAADHYRVCLQMGKTLKQRDRKPKVNVIDTQTHAHKLKSSGELIDGILEYVKDNLGVLTDTRVSSDFLKEIDSKLQFHKRSDGTTMPLEVRQTKIAFNPHLSEEEIGRMLAVGGDSCDHCHKTREEAGRTLLDSCARCKRAYYCSRECQRAQWKQGHKDHCRIAGEIKPDDYLQIKGIQSKPELNGCVVQIVGPAPTSGRWEVRVPYVEKSMSISQEKLVQLRPLK